MDIDGLNLGLLILRLATGLMIIAHGYNHVFRGGKIQGTAGWFASMGMKPGIVHAWTASLTEFGAGAMLCLGLLTPLAAAGVLGVMVVAFMTAHRTNGFFIFRPGQGWEYVGFISMVCLALGATGGGEWSLDHAAGWELSGLGWFAVTAIGGIGGAGLLLAAFWRPEKKPAT